ncbi:class I SAM-dependent methyltransferase [Desulfobacterales bacterium HSG2]|nr:class I SAM-dependent methyltransferase [Desulfobacterales bacterium HSG2]
MGYVFNSKDAGAYEEWFDKPENRFVTELEGQLMLNMLKPMRGETVIDIGCGSGWSLLPFLEAGLSVSGLDPSQHMLDIASDHLGNRVDLFSGFAEELPFDDNSFHNACLVKTLEFAEDPEKAIEEACRVAKNRVFIGLMNRHSLRGTGLRVKRIFTDTIYKHARFFSIWELKQIIRTILGDVPISWRTICQFSTARGRISNRIECSELVQRFPFGAFTGIKVTLVPRFRTRPLELPCPAEAADGVATGLARTKWR